MLTHRITLFHLLGFRIQLDASWFFLAILIVWSLSASLFPAVMPGLDTATYWRMGIVGLLGFAASIVAHELAHAIVARRYDMPIRSITLFIFGGVAEMEREPPSARAEFWVAIAGPVMSLAVAVFFALLAGALGGPMVPPGLEEGGAEPRRVSPDAVVFAYLAFINVVLAVFNMIPAFPLDGGRVLRAALWGLRGDIIWATRIAGASGSAFAVVLIVWAGFNLMAGNVVGGIWYFILGLFLHMAAQGQVQHQTMHQALSHLPVRRFMRKDVVAVAPDISVDRLIADYFYRHYYKSFPVMEGHRLVGIVDAADIRGTERPEGVRVRDVMHTVEDDLTIDPDSDSAAALRKMQMNGRTRLLVMERGELVGVLSLRDLMNYLSIREDIGRAR